MNPQKKTQRINSSSTLEQFFLVFITVACVLGFLVGAYGSWEKYRSEPVSPISMEVDTDDEPMPSVTLCRYRIVNMMRNMTSMDEIREEMGFRITYLQFG